MNDHELTGAALQERVLRFIGDPAAQDFDALALDIFRRQWRDNAPYRKICDLRGIRPEKIRTWQDIPAVSTTAFKKLRLTCGPSNVVFRTSGTTRGVGERGEHHLPTTAVYEAALREEFRKHVLPGLNSVRMIVLTPSPSWAPDSSLAFMMGEVVKRFGRPGSDFYLDRSGLRFEPLVEALARSEAGNEPVLVLGTAMALLHLCEKLDASRTTFRLPAGSRIMDTGGFKGMTRATSRPALIQGYERCLGVAPSSVVNEYGMTELSSQFYAPFSGEGTLHVGPHWVRARVVDPRTGLDAHVAPRHREDPRPVRAGLLRFMDLANVHSVIAVETEDLAEIPEGSPGNVFCLMRRVRGSLPRGCSLAAEEMIEGLTDV